MRNHRVVRTALRNLILSPDPRTLPGDPAAFVFGVIVGQDAYDERVLRDWLESRVHAVETTTWDGIAGQLRLLGDWEFESYRP